MKQPRIIIFDIETSPVENLRFQKDRSPYIPSNSITNDSYMISAAWKMLGEKTIHYVASPKVWNDYQTVKTLRNVLSKADILIGHNIDKFDLKYLNARLIYHSLPPLPIIATVDTLKEVKKVAFFTGHSLGYLASYILNEEKIGVNFDLWKKVVKGNKTALREMVKYNKQDVVVTEKWYNHLKPYMKAHPHIGVLSGENRLYSCNKCGGTHLKKNGFRVTTAGLKKTRSTMPRLWQLSTNTSGVAEMKYYIEVSYNIGDTVYLKTDVDQRARIITSVWIRPNNQILYECSQGTQVSNHYDFELNQEVDVLVKATTD